MKIVKGLIVTIFVTALFSTSLSAYLFSQRLTDRTTLNDFEYFHHGVIEQLPRTVDTESISLAFKVLGIAKEQYWLIELIYFCAFSTSITILFLSGLSLFLLHRQQNETTVQHT